MSIKPASKPSAARSWKPIRTALLSLLFVWAGHAPALLRPSRSSSPAKAVACYPGRWLARHLSMWQASWVFSPYWGPSHAWCGTRQRNSLSQTGASSPSGTGPSATHAGDERPRHEPADEHRRCPGRPGRRRGLARASGRHDPSAVVVAQVKAAAVLTGKNPFAGYAAITTSLRHVDEAVGSTARQGRYGSPRWSAK